MLMKTPYLTAEDLKIRPIEHEYLIRFVEGGEVGKLPEQHRFDMENLYRPAWWVERRDCGTVGCIAGTMQAYAVCDGRLSELAGSCVLYWSGNCSYALEQLFYGRGYELPGGATLSQAVSCTKHFLQTGVVDWPLALKDA